MENNTFTPSSSHPSSHLPPPIVPPFTLPLSPGPIPPTGLSSPSSSLSANSSLLSMHRLARAELTTLLDEAGNNTNSSSGIRAKNRFELEDNASFAHVPYASLTIDCSWRDLLFAYRTTLLAPESAESRRELYEKIARLFTQRRNVYESVESMTAAASTSSASSTSSAASSSSRIPPPSLINVNSTLSSSLVAPKYLLSEHNIFTGLSARTCLDLYLTSRAFPRGSFILLSAINIPDMSVVLKAHGLVPVPIDVDVDTLEPDLVSLNQAAGRVLNGQKAVAILVAHLFGRRFAMDEIVRIGHAHGLDVIEDLAQSFSGFEYVGHPQSELTLFSFGTIKISTGFGGGVARVRNRRTFDDMIALQSQLPVQTRGAYFHKCVKNSLTMLALNHSFTTRTICSGARRFNIDHRGMVVAMLRGFPDKLMERLRTQPSTALLSMLYHRLSSFDPIVFQHHQDNCDLMIELLPKGVTVPGRDAPVRNHWLFPVLVDHSDDVLKELVNAGIDTFKGATQLALVPKPDGFNGQIQSTPKAAKIMEQVIYLPVDRRLSTDAIVRIAATMHRVIERVEKRHQRANGQLVSKL